MLKRKADLYIGNDKVILINGNLKQILLQSAVHSNFSEDIFQHIKINTCSFSDSLVPLLCKSKRFKLKNS